MFYIAGDYEISYIFAISVALSFLSAVNIMASMHFRRIKKSYKLKRKKLSCFEKFPIDL